MTDTNNFMDLTIPEYSYMLGFIQCDGHLGESARNRGRLSIEINIQDIHLLERIMGDLF